MVRGLALGPQASPERFPLTLALLQLHPLGIPAQLLARALALALLQQSPTRVAFHTVHGTTVQGKKQWGCACPSRSLASSRSARASPNTGDPACRYQLQAHLEQRG